MSLAQEVELIRQVPLLAKLEPTAQKMLCFASERVFYGTGETVFRQGDTADAAYVIIDGEVEIAIATISGSMRINTVQNFEVFGEIGMFGELPRTASAVAITPLELLRVPRDVFHKVIHASPAAVCCLTSTLAERLSRTTGQLSEAVLAHAA